MIEKLIQMAKNGMFDIAFLLAEKNNLKEELFNSLRKDYDISFEELKELVSLEEKNDTEYLDLCYNLDLLHCVNSYIKELELINDKLCKLYCYENIITKIDISKCKNLTYLYCGYNNITTLDLSNNVNLIELSCVSNNITSLDLSNNKKLKIIKCGSNDITSLDVSKCMNLTELYCSSNQIRNLDLSKHLDLIVLNCSCTQITDLDLSMNKKLTELYCYSDDLKLVKLHKSVKGKIYIDVYYHTKIEYVE